MAISAQGFGLPYPTAPFPTTVTSGNVPQLNGTNIISLGGGGTVIVNSGYVIIDPGQYSFVQEFDPIMQMWSLWATSDQNGQTYLNSDGFNFRVVNPTGCTVGVNVTNGGAGYVAGTPPAVTFSSGGAIATAIVGGALGTITLFSSSSLTVTSGAGANFTYAPIVSIQAPPQGGVPATAIANLSGTQLNNGSPFTIVNQGAGYVSPPLIQIIPNPADPSTTIRPASAVATLTGATSVTAVLVTNYGNGALGGVPLCTIAAPTAGTQATGQAIVALSTTAFAITQGGSGYGTSPTTVMSVGGLQSGGAFTNPNIQTGIYLPRPAQYLAQVSTGASGGSVTASGQLIVDGGIFQNAAVGFVATQNGGVTTGATGTFTFGANTDTVTIQPIGGNG